MDEGNNVAENGINGAINYAERNSLATIGTKTFITIDEDEDEEDSHHTQNRGIYLKMVKESFLQLQTIL